MPAHDKPPRTEPRSRPPAPGKHATAPLDTEQVDETGRRPPKAKPNRQEYLDARPRRPHGAAKH